jgi:putative DNA methylase
VQSLTGLNQEAKGLYRDENVFEDADVQMAGYAAALRVLTRYAVIDGRDMTTEAIRPRVKGDMTQRELAVDLADYLAKCLEELRPEEASAARVLRELVKSQRLG